MFCRNCGKEVEGNPEVCPFCGLSPLTSLGDVYKPHFELISLSPEQRRLFTQHGFRLTFSIDALIGMHFITLGLFTLFLFGLKHLQMPLVLTFSIGALIGMHFITLGLFTLIFFGLKHSQMPLIRHDDFGARKAIGFMFIPFFNLYWQFKFWLRLVDRVNFQSRLAGLRPAISRKLMLATIIVGLVPGVNAAAFLVMYPICIVRIQRACNELAEASLEPGEF
jgi:hypothetical protein